jgi:hypothetical protein
MEEYWEDKRTAKSMTGIGQLVSANMVMLGNYLHKTASKSPMLRYRKIPRVKQIEEYNKVRMAT